MISERFLRAGSRKASVVVSILTAKPSAFSQPRIIEAHRSGSCPGQPPHTIIASRMFCILYLTNLAGRKSRRYHRRTLDGGFEFYAASLIRGYLKRLHRLQHMQRQRAAGAVWPVADNG